MAAHTQQSQPLPRPCSTSRQPFMIESSCCLVDWRDASKRRRSGSSSRAAREMRSRAQGFWTLPFSHLLFPHLFSICAVIMDPARTPNEALLQQLQGLVAEVKAQEERCRAVGGPASG